MPCPSSGALQLTRALIGGELAPADHRDPQLCALAPVLLLKPPQSRSRHPRATSSRSETSHTSIATSVPPFCAAHRLQSLALSSTRPSVDVRAVDVPFSRRRGRHPRSRSSTLPPATYPQTGRPLGYSMVIVWSGTVRPAVAAAQPGALDTRFTASDPPATLFPLPRSRPAASPQVCSMILPLMPLSRFFNGALHNRRSLPPSRL